MNLKSFYFVVTFEGIGGRWQRSIKLQECLYNLRNPKKYTIYIGICKEDTPTEIVSNLSYCWNVDNFGGLSFYITNKTEEEQKQFDIDLEQKYKYFLGWIIEDVDLTKNKKLS